MPSVGGESLSDFRLITNNPASSSPLSAVDSLCCLSLVLRFAGPDFTVDLLLLVSNLVFTSPSAANPVNSPPFHHHDHLSISSTGETPSMSNTDFLGRAIDTVKKAIECDNDGEYEKAYQTYYSALELFMLALKWEKNPRSKEMIRAKTGEYMERAEKLKNHLASTENRKRPSAVGANGKVAPGSGKGGYAARSSACAVLLY